ncbi:hypothetical protein E3P98_01656 [Wallemia ichthyophaga]|nr:hypothetical protein E3P98_01656 [Wallemia ichthyophaga]
MNWVGILKKVFKICVKEIEKHQEQQSEPTPAPSQKPTGEYIPPKESLGEKRINGQAAEQYWMSQPEYTELRDRANAEGDKMGRCFDAASSAYTSGDGGRAKELSNEGKEHKKERSRINKQAADWIFEKNNLDNRRDEVDLHGLYVKEAMGKVEEAIANARVSNINPLKVVVGRGTHSKNHVSKMKPAIEGMMRKENLRCRVDPTNAGQLLVYLDGQGDGTDNAEDVAKDTEDACSAILAGADDRRVTKPESRNRFELLSGVTGERSEEFSRRRI